MLKLTLATCGLVFPRRQGGFHLFCHTYGTWMHRYGGLDSFGLARTDLGKTRAVRIAIDTQRPAKKRGGLTCYLYPSGTSLERDRWGKTADSRRDQRKPLKNFRSLMPSRGWGRRFNPYTAHHRSCSSIFAVARFIVFRGGTKLAADARRITSCVQTSQTQRASSVKFLGFLLLLIIGPVVLSAAAYLLGERRDNWQTADRSSAGLLPKPSQHPEAVIRVYAARTVRWRGIFAVHTWIVVKERGAPRYTRYDYTAWGEPVRVDGFAPDGRWFGALPETVLSLDGEAAERFIPRIRSVVENYKFSTYGDYQPWPGPNSNTFVQAALDSVPELNAVLPPTAIGKDYPYEGKWYGLTPRGGLFVTLGGYLGLVIGWVEGVELNLLGGVIGMDVRRPAIKLPGLGRLGMPLSP
jgi:hypothetical protein